MVRPPISRTSVSGEPRGPLCGMGVCFECRSESGSRRRTCLARTEWKQPPERAEVVVVGAGPAGLAAAATAAELGVSVLLVDENDGPGGQIWRGGSDESHSLAGRAPQAGALLLGGVAVADAESGRTLHLTDPEGRRSARVEYDRLILATGARELFLPFPGWTLPGVVGAGGLQALVKSGLDIVGARVVVAGSGPLLLAAAAFLAGEGAEVVAVCEQAAITSAAMPVVTRPRLIGQAAGLRLALGPTEYLFGTWVSEAFGRGRLEGVVITDGRRRWSERCDWLACGYGLVPNLELARLLGCRASEAGVEVDVGLRTSVEGVFAAGEVLGIGGIECAVTEGALAAFGATGTRPPLHLEERRRRLRAAARAMADAFVLRSEISTLARDDILLCRCEDVTVVQARRHGSLREAKLQTRLGMGPCQGRICGAAARVLFGWGADRVRPPLVPMTVEALGRD